MHLKSGVFVGATEDRATIISNNFVLGFGVVKCRITLHMVLNSASNTFYNTSQARAPNFRRRSFFLKRKLDPQKIFSKVLIYEP